MYEDISDLVINLESNYLSGNGVLMSKYVRTDLYTDLNTIDAYLNSKHISGEQDSLGRDKPFFNIVIASRNIYYRATDIDRKNIMAKPTKTSDIVGAFLLSVHLQDYMRRENFGTFLNNWGMVLAGYNSAVVKFVEKEGRLVPIVCDWNKLIVDQINFYNNPVIEVLELNKSQMIERGYNKEVVDDLFTASSTRQILDKQTQDNRRGFIKVYEVHGMFPVSWITDNESDNKRFSQQMHVLSFIKAKNGKDFDKFSLFRGEEEKSPYMLTALLPATDGSISVDGSVKNLFQAQWMMNHSIKAIKDQLDLASKLIFQTADGNFVGQNALYAVESGDILIHELNKPLTAIQNNSHDITSLQNFGTQWKQLSSEINGISEAMLGQNPPSGTAWRQTEALLGESHSLFELMTENKGLAIEDMMRTFVFPYLKKKMNTSKEISATLDTHGIKEIENKYVKNRAIELSNETLKKQVLSGQIAEQPDIAQLEQSVRDNLQEMGTQRFFKPSDIDDSTWKDVLKDIVWDVEVEITGENVDKQAVFTTLNTALQVAANPNFANNPTAQLVVGKILTETGKISPMEWSAVQNQTKTQNNTQTAQNGGKVASEQLQELAKQGASK